MCKIRDNPGNSAYLSLGANLGDCQRNLIKALKKINNVPEVKQKAVSCIYRTEPQGDSEQPWFYNQVAHIATCLEPLEFLRALRNIENEMGRERDPQRRFGPRVIDLDLLHYSGITMSSPELILPHPRMWERAFVLVPLVEVACGDLLAKARAALSRLDYVLDNDKIFQNN